MIGPILFLAYVISCLVVARAVYTRFDRGEWMPTQSYNDQAFFAVAVPILWPAALVIWLGYKFVTGGAKSK